MRKPRRPRSAALAAALAAVLLLPLPAWAQSTADEPPTPLAQEMAAKAFDAIIVRPFGLAAAIVGVALFVPAAIVSAPGGRDALEEAFDRFVAPSKALYERPLGDF